MELGRRRVSRVIRTAVVATVVIASTAVAGLPANAATYYFRPGHPTYLNGPNSTIWCTGGYAIRGASGMFVLTAGHCRQGAADDHAPVGPDIYGKQRKFGDILHNMYPGHDTGLIGLHPGDDALQIVTDPLTLASPGRIVDIFPERSLKWGCGDLCETLVGKMGNTTGWTEGTLSHTVVWHGMTAYCSRAHTRGGDSGGPVWRTGPGGVYAVGITVAAYESGPYNGFGCFIAIQDLLDLWGAWLPVFAPAGLRSVSWPAGGGPATPADAYEHLVPA